MPSSASSAELHAYLTRRIDPAGSYAGLLRFPRFINLETINLCNARCPMCTIADWSRHAPAMKDELFAKIAEEMIANRDEIRRVSLYQDGEPLLDKKIAERIFLLKKGGIKEVAISTNASLLDEKKSEELLSAGLDSIILSVDSLKKEIYESIRVRLDHGVVMANALRFIQMRDAKKSKTKVWVRMVRQEANAGEWPEYERFWRQRLLPSDRVNFHNVHNWGGQLPGFKAIEPSFEPSLPCVALWSLMVIFANGDVPLCNVDYLSRYPAGNLAQTSIAELWRSGLANQRRELHLSGHKGQISLCQNCNAWDEPPDIEKFASSYGRATALPAHP